MSAGNTNQPLTNAEITRVRELFGQVCDLPPSDRDAILNKECAAHPSILAAVNDLLAAHDAPAILDTRNSGVGRQLLKEVDAVPIADSIGPYKIRSVIGKGGMGIVYLAQQTNPDREVALKIIRRTWNFTALNARFEREIRVLGRLKHPGITHIYEAGTADTKEGPVAFFAMEYVNGKPLTDAVKELNLTVPERIELLAKVADAVQHAHTKGVIHRDLKPANILVSDTRAESIASNTSNYSTAGGPQPKILDFGVARVLEPDTVQTQVTEAGHVIGTISYMSPEQLGGDIDSVDARTDVYGLGVILYELISGRLPHELRGKQIAEAARIVRDDPPASLSKGGGGGQRIDRDLETITLHAMNKDREHRYPTAAAFAEDLRRYLRNETILARPASAVDQFSKFARRNKGLVFGLSAAAVALAAGLVISTVLYFKEQKARRLADAKEHLNAAFKEYMIDGVLMAASPDRKGWEVKVMDVLADARTGLHEKFANEPEIEASLHFDLANILLQLGKAEEAKAEALAALPMLESQLGHDSDKVISTLDLIAISHQNMQQNDEWEKVARDALSRAERSLPPGHVIRISAMNNLAGALVTKGKCDEARPILDKARAAAELDQVTNREPLANIYNWLTACETAAGNAKAALEMRRTNFEFMVKAFGPDFRDTLAARSNLMLALLYDKQVKEALELANGLPEAVERQFPPDHPARGHAYGAAASVMIGAGKYPEAEKYALKSYELQVALVKDVDWFTEQRIQMVAKVYERWRNHPEQLKEWLAQSVKARLMLATVDELGSLPAVLNNAVRDCAASGLTVTKSEMIQYVWDHRDTFAPAGNGRRAAFYANFVCMAIPEGQTGHLQEGLALATQSVASETDADNAKSLISAAQNMLSAPLTPPSK